MFKAIITVNPSPSIINKNQEETICSGATLNKTQSGIPANTTYSWSEPTVIPSNTISGFTAKIQQHLVKASQTLRIAPLQQTIP